MLYDPWILSIACKSVVEGAFSFDGFDGSDYSRVMTHVTLERCRPLNFKQAIETHAF